MSVQRLNYLTKASIRPLARLNFPEYDLPILYKNNTLWFLCVKCTIQEANKYCSYCTISGHGGKNCIPTTVEKLISLKKNI